ncbi:phospholipase A1-IIgamma-like [Mercurialis annua]|uniref:phospholipase A1-IIgamma-like n=1 Tax=Mercurialis annua TaxID=3986 RepID=UPI00215F846C|nr:phospholipase A1-IIgamma-like [Mercurialis annua]
MADIAAHWKILSGENNWEGLLKPIDDNLRRYLIHYGELTRALSDSFNDVKASNAYGLCRYPPKELFGRVGLQFGNPFKYQVSDYIYARTEIKIDDYIHPGMCTYIGFVAVSSDEGKRVLGRRDIVVCWRGTTSLTELLEDFEVSQVSAADIFPNSKAKVHHGFHSIYTTNDQKSKYTKASAREQALAAVRRLVDKYYEADPNEVMSITVVGHSLGGSLATLNAMDIAANKYNKPTKANTELPVTAFVFAALRVGNEAFLEIFSGLTKLHLLGVKNAFDIVPEFPPKYTIFHRYEDVGIQLKIDTKGSPFIKVSHTYINKHLHAHDFNLYLHGIAGYQGKGKAFKLVVNLDISLLNKYTDILLNVHNVPPKWWSNVMNKGMVQRDDGSWKLQDYFPDPPRYEVSKNVSGQ